MNTRHELRIPPQAPDVERTVLGSMLLDAPACAQGVDMLSEDSFYMTKHRNIFAVVRELFSSGAPVDIITVSDILAKKGLLDAVGSEAYLSELASYVATVANIEHYAKILLEKAILRRLITVSGEITAEAFTPDAEPAEILGSAESKIFGISAASAGKSGGLLPLSAIVPETIQRMRTYSPTRRAGLSTGFAALDALTAGLVPGNLVVVAGRPSMGKTAFALSVAMHTARSVAGTVVIFSLEMPRTDLTERMSCMSAGVSMHALRTGALSVATIDSMGAAGLERLPIRIDDTAGIKVSQMRSRLYLVKDLVLVLVDYMQLMHGDGENRERVVAGISAGLKELAKEKNVPVVALSQFSREVEKRGNLKSKKNNVRAFAPTLSDLRESGAIEQDCDLVLALYRPEYYGITDDKGFSTKGRADMLVLKQRNGPTGTAYLRFHKQSASFSEWKEGEGEKDSNDKFSWNEYHEQGGKSEPKKSAA